MNCNMRTTLLAGIALLLLPCTSVVAGDKESLSLSDNTKRLSYSLGYQIGGDFKRQGVEMNAEAVVMGIEDALTNADPQISRKAMGEILTELKRKVVAGDRKKLTNRASRSRENELKYVADGREFLEQNAEKPGVKSTRSGLQYKIIEPGSNKRPKPTDKVTVNYRGTLVNGQEFDSTYEHGEPGVFHLDEVIPGWTEGLQLIGEGGKIQLVVPHVLAYRNSGPLAHRTLIFDVELLSVRESEIAASAQ